MGGGNIRKDFKRSVKIALIERGWTQKDLARKLGYSESYISMVVNGTRNNEDIVKQIRVVLRLDN